MSHEPFPDDDDPLVDLDPNSPTYEIRKRARERWAAQDAKTLRPGDPGFKTAYEEHVAKPAREEDRAYRDAYNDGKRAAAENLSQQFSGLNALSRMAKGMKAGAPKKPSANPARNIRRSVSATPKRPRRR